MREILFRGKRIEDGKWIYGYYLDGKTSMADFPCITPFSGDAYDDDNDWEVDIETVGQFTGLTDKNGKKIFEGDIVHWKKVPYFVRWDSKKAEFVFANDMEDDYFVVGFNEHTTMKFCKVVGNIHDNPELLEE